MHHHHWALKTRLAGTSHMEGRMITFFWVFSVIPMQDTGHVCDYADLWPIICLLCAFLMALRNPLKGSQKGAKNSLLALLSRHRISHCIQSDVFEPCLSSRQARAEVEAGGAAKRGEIAGALWRARFRLAHRTSARRRERPSEAVYAEARSRDHCPCIASED